MRIQILSDLHLEQGYYSNDRVKGAIKTGKPHRISSYQRHPDADVLVLAGDIVSSEFRTRLLAKHLNWFDGRPVIYVMGNHEYYGWDWAGKEKYTDTVREMLQGKNVHVLENGFVEIDDIFFLGCTMWSNLSSAFAPSGWSDFQWIQNFHQNDYDQKHYESIAFLEMHLSFYKHKRKVVVTHHVPSFAFTEDRWRNHPDNVFFSSSQDRLMHPYGVPDGEEGTAPELWVCGHTHHFFDEKLGETRVVCNPGGYGNGGGLEIPDFVYKKEYLVEI